MHHAGRDAGIDGRTRARRIANLRARQSFARLPETQRRNRLAWLAQLAGAVEAGSFTDAELREAQAALIGERNPRQQRLDLGTSRDART
jgi:hypothetical protein